MSLLSDRINQAVGEHTDASGRCDIHKVIQAVKPDLSEDDIDRYVDRGLAGDAKGAATRGKAELKRRAATQGEFPFPELRHGYAIDAEEKYIKNTVDLSEVEFKRVIAIREKQIEFDQKHVDALQAAYQAGKPIWAKHPTWTFGRVCEEVMRQAKRGNAA